MSVERSPGTPRRLQQVLRCAEELPWPIRDQGGGDRGLRRSVLSVQRLRACTWVSAGPATRLLWPSWAFNLSEPAHDSACPHGPAPWPALGDAQ